jgi:hypothetical protein
VSRRVASVTGRKRVRARSRHGSRYRLRPVRRASNAPRETRKDKSKQGRLKSALASRCQRTLRSTDSGASPLRVDAVDKHFSRRKRATLIRDKSLARNIDSKKAAPGFDCCGIAARRRLYRQHRSIPDLEAISLVRFVPCVDGSGLASQNFTLRRWSVQPCVRPVSAVRMTAGHNALRGPGPGQKPAFDDALAHVGCPDRRIDRLCAGGGAVHSIRSRPSTPPTGPLWPGNLVAGVPREVISIGGVLEASTGREQQVIMFIEVVKAADVEARAVLATDRIRRLIKYFSPECQLFSELPL